MPRSSGSFFSLLSSLFTKLLGKRIQPPSQPRPAPPLPDNPNEPARITTNRVLLLVYDPVLNNAGQRLSQMMGWAKVEDLIAGFKADIMETSGGMARFDIVQRMDVNEFPVKADGFQYDPESYMNVIRGITPRHTPDLVDYESILARFNILQRVSQHEIDEVWVFAFPHAGFYESVMAGKGAFWCNAAPLRNTHTSPRRFVIMGFSYERGVGEMHESMGHRIESIMTKVFEPLHGEADLWKKFTRYDKVAPGQAEVGTIHFAPNSERDYDWNNPRIVPSFCDDWLTFPHFTGFVKEVNADEWGNGNMRAHHRWWMQRIPHVSGRKNGIHHNWWQYILTPDEVKL